MTLSVCSVDYLFHYLFNPDEALIASILAKGLRPLSDFPDSPRWQTIEAAYPGFFRWLYEEFAEPVVRQPYRNSGVFLTPIDFRLMPCATKAATQMASSPRI